ncbi:immunoglobulin-like domain-containing protein [uncultured Planococcus sp.]|uniref:immunoglobulin-like domain-containing protein n=1 Tax=uncultured Planococcus sp. TaxID=337815 RepID=UPI002635FB32|nr:immunoglobulin-like domain-containing protein [uncultured Planococcus sp.]
MGKIILFLMIAVFLVACGNDSTVATIQNPSPDQELASSKAGLSLLLEEHSYEGSPSIIATTIKNDSMQDYGFGQYFHIELKRKSGWHILTHSDAVFINNPQLNDFGRVLAAGDETDMDFSVKELGIVLAPGEYRIVKTFLSQEAPIFEISIASSFVVN